MFFLPLLSILCVYAVCKHVHVFACVGTCIRIYVCMHMGPEVHAENQSSSPFTSLIESGSLNQA